MATGKSQYARGKHPNSLKNLKKTGWQPGQSGNPAGRPKRIKYLSEALREQLADPKVADELARELIKRAKKGDTALNMIWERTEGKVTQPIGGDPNMPIIIDKIVAHITGDKNGSNDSTKQNNS